jgi:hypothetical protein
MYGGRSAARHMATSFGDVTVEFVKWEYENNSRVKVYRMSKNFQEIGQAREYEDGNWQFSTTPHHHRATASRYSVDKC